MGKPSKQLTGVKDSRAALKETWDLIVADVAHETKIELARAANVIGFLEFPVGWNWVEYPKVLFEKRSLVQFKMRLGLSEPGEDSICGQKAAASGSMWRRSHVEKRLRCFVGSDDCTVVFIDETCKPTIAGRSTMLDPTLSFDISDGSIGVQNSIFNAYVLTESFWRFVDAKEPAPWKARKSVHDHFKIERWLRSYIERHGVPATQRELIGACWEWQTACGCKETPLSTMQVWVAMLEAEYSTAE